ncbi:hypothetical protein K469DRAFT_691982 [Zopfia rhizophila CBS 207.26]|uniref:Uncharacterized protein n=1 Tax=Zopfia rhizophila CBS 207.26 TaxID=1314779 RepID=A0A6A6DR46_9PEZI|nr:hypothetical protein K469DRAFT_691982 [Zopfia rhizophila CBS 207.26]
MLSETRSHAPLHPPNLLNPGRPERAPSSARHRLPLSPNDLPVQSLDETELNPDRITQNAREKSAPENLPSNSNKEPTEWGNKELAELLNKTIQPLGGEEKTTAVVSPKLPPNFTIQSPLHINEKHHLNEQTFIEQTNEPVSEPPGSGNHSNNFREEKNDDNKEPRPPMKQRKKSPRQTGDATLTPPSGHRSRRRLGRHLSLMSDTTHLLVESEALPNPRKDRLSSASQTSRTLGIPSDGKTSTSPATIHGAQSQPKTLSTTKEAEPKRGKWTPEEDETLRSIRENGHSWDEIHGALPHRTKGTIQVRYSTKLKN